MRSRWTIVAAALGAVLVAAIALILANRGGAKADATGAGSSAASGSAASAASAAPGPATPAPSLETPTPVAPSVDHESTTVDTVGDTGARTSDHRSDPGEIHDTPVRPRSGPPVHLTDTFAVGVANLIAPIASACAAQIPSEARGSAPVIQVRMTVSIKRGQLSIDDVSSELRDVTGDQDAVKDCVKSKAGALSIDATGQPDVDHYPITMPMRVTS